MVGLLKSESGSPQNYVRIVKEVLDRVCEMEDSLEPTLWVENLDPLIPTQESKAIRAKTKQHIQQSLEEADFELGVDFEITPNGSIRLLSDEAKESLREALSKQQWEWLLFSRIIRF